MTYFIRSTFARNGGQLVDPAKIINGCPDDICEKRVADCPSGVYKLTSRAQSPSLMIP